MSQQQTLDDLLRSPRMPAYLRQLYAELQAQRLSSPGCVWSVANVLHGYEAFRDGLQAALTASASEQSAGITGDCEAELHAAVIGQRHLLSHLSPGQKEVLSLAEEHVATHNLQQPWDVVERVHKNMLDSAGLTQAESEQIAHRVLPHITAMAVVMRERENAISTAAEQLRLSQGPIVHQEIRRWLHTRDLLGTLQGLYDRESHARSSIWLLLLQAEVLDVQQSAQLQVSWHPQIIPDLCMMANMVLANLGAASPMQPPTDATPQAARSRMPPRQADPTQGPAGSYLLDGAGPASEQTPTGLAALNMDGAAGPPALHADVAQAGEGPVDASAAPFPLDGAGHAPSGELPLDGAGPLQ